MPENEDTHGAGYVAAVIGVAAALVVVIVGASTIAALNHGVPKELWAIGGALAGALVGILAPSPKMTRAKPSPADAAARTMEKATKAASKQAKKEKKQDAAAAQDAAKEVVTAGHSQIAEIDRVPPSGQGATVMPATLAAGRVAQALASKLAAAAQGESPSALRVHEEAYKAAVTEVRETAAAESGQPSWLGGVATIVREPKILVPLIIFVVGLGVGIPLGLGMIAAEPCRELIQKGSHVLAPSCSYYATATQQAANVLISLASAAAGALIGIFAKSPGEPADGSKPAGAAG